MVVDLRAKALNQGKEMGKMGWASRILAGFVRVELRSLVDIAALRG